MINKLSLILMFFYSLFLAPQYVYATYPNTINSSTIQRDELRIPFDINQKHELPRSILVQALLCSLTTWVLHEKSSPNSFFNSFNSLCMIPSKAIGLMAHVVQKLSAISFLIFSYIYINMIMNEETPIAILNKKGICIEEFGLVSWNAIEEMTLLKRPESPIRYVAIQIKQDSLPALYNQSSNKAKRYLFLIKILKYKYHVFLSSSSFPMDKVISFSKRFIPQKIKEHLVELYGKSDVFWRISV